MAAKTDAKAAAKPAGKRAATPKPSEVAGNSAASPGAGAAAGTSTAAGGATEGAASGGAQGAGDGDADAARLLLEEMGLIEDEALAMDAAFNEARAQAAHIVLMHDEALGMDADFNKQLERNEALSLLEDEARAMDAARTESLETTQTGGEEGAGGAVDLNVWALPEIGEFPATVILENHTRNRIGVPGANVALDPYEQVEVTVSLEQYAKLAKSLSSSARAHKWDNLKGLQVKYDRKD